MLDGSDPPALTPDPSMTLEEGAGGAAAPCAAITLSVTTLQPSGEIELTEVSLFIECIRAYNTIPCSYKYTNRSNSNEVVVCNIDTMHFKISFV